jgi:phosphoenolpyruvate-protein phosphotransferase
MARLVLEGRAGSSGSGIGRIVWLGGADASASAAPSARVEGGQRSREQDRLRQALEQASEELARLAEHTRARAGADTAAIFEAQALFVQDPVLVDQALAAIADDGLGAADAIGLAAATQADVLATLEDDYFRARAADVRDVGKRVAAILEGRPRPVLHTPTGEPAVVAADDLDASIVAELRPELVAGVALAGGAPTGHAAIVARALGIPLVLGLGGALLAIPEGEEVMVDGTLGRILIAPDQSERQTMVTNGASQAAPATRLPPLALPVAIEANAGSAREVEQAADAGAHGIGLLRTELLFLGRTVAPSLDEQRALYRRIRMAMPNGPVVFRTLDVGGDKPAGYRPAVSEANPALGVRGVRLGLRHPELLEVQLRALLESAPELSLHLMFPMVSTLEEVRDARAALAAAASASRGAGLGVAPDVQVGIMIEVPAAALMADALAPEVDFFSIGTNDLIQYTMAADRTSADLADLGTPLQPAVLRLVGSVCRAAREHRRPVAVCGEAAADPLIAPLLVGLGVSQLSVGVNSVRRVHQALAGLTLADCRRAAGAALGARTAAEVRAIAHSLLGTPG